MCKAIGLKVPDRAGPRRSLCKEYTMYLQYKVSITTCYMTGKYVFRYLSGFSPFYFNLWKYFFGI